MTKFFLKIYVALQGSENYCKMTSAYQRMSNGIIYLKHSFNGNKLQNFPTVICKIIPNSTFLCSKCVCWNSRLLVIYVIYFLPSSLS